ncbi:hypothetical protein [Paenibacillus polymyxa]|uniref:Uncharacterized protein n=1 Tax=Paenibacillus polymyxa TaxID=1406 RepID=A0ABX2ZB87_PAEPO|nr:hypothetical protein [Paenibacillus polymyxa]ODA08705.1 hypothetical protein A7312_04685 [Paenibacillus polymyxa]
MPVQINITGEDANQAIQEFSVLSAAFVGAKTPAAVPVQPTPQEDKPKRNRTTTPKPEPEEESKQDEDVKNDAKGDDQPTVKLEEVRAKAAELSKAGKQAGVKEVISSFDVPNLSKIPKDKLAEALEKLTALEEAE